MKVIRVLAFNTVKEVLRDRVLYGLVLFAVFLLLLSLLLGGLSFTEQQRIIIDFGLLGSNLGCAMLSIFVGSTLVWREIDKQTVLLLISKPVNRSEFLIGKFLGLTLVLVLVNILVAGLMALLCLQFEQVHWQQLMVAEAGIFLESVLILAIVIFFGVFCSPVVTVLFGLSFWFLGHGLDDLNYFSQKSPSAAFRSFGAVISRVLPNLNYFNFREAVIYGDAIKAESVEKAVILACAWFVILIISSTWIFNRRDFI